MIHILGFLIATITIYFIINLCTKFSITIIDTEAYRTLEHKSKQFDEISEYEIKNREHFFRGNTLQGIKNNIENSDERSQTLYLENQLLIKDFKSSDWYKNMVNDLRNKTLLLEKYKKELDEIKRVLSLMGKKYE